MAESKKIGARIVLDGEQEFRQSINNSKTALKALDSELKLTQTQFKNQEKSLEALQKTQQTYVKQQQALQKQEKAYVEQIEKASKAHDEAVKDYEKLGKTVEDLKKQLDDAKKTYGENSDEVKKLSDELQKTESDYNKQGTAISNLENKQNRWQNELNNTRIQLTEVEQNLEETNKAIDHYGEEVEDAGEQTENATESTDKLGVSFGKLVSADLVADVIKRVASALVDMAKACIETGSEFEKAMSNVSALSGATGAELDGLSEKAQQLGASTMFSASQAADAFSYMALAGWDTKSMLEGIEPVLNLAAASNMDLAEASDIVTDYLTAFGLEAQDAGRFTDQLAYAMANSNTDVTMLGEAYKNCAAAAGSMGYSVEDVTGALMTMANAGVKGGEAGTSLRAIMINLATDTNGCASKLEDYGVQVYDTNGKMRNLSDILVDTASAFEGLSDQESNSLAKVIAGKTQYTGFQTIMLGLSEAAKDAGMSMTDYADALANCDGYAKEMAKTMQDNLQGDLTILESAMDGLKIAAYECFDEGMRTSVQAASDSFSVLTDSIKNGDLGDSLNDLGNSFGEIAESMAILSETELPELIDKLNWILDHKEDLKAWSLLIPSNAVLIGMKEMKECIEEINRGSGDLEHHARQIRNNYDETATAYDKARFALDGLSDSEKMEQEIALGSARLKELANERADAEERLVKAKERLSEFDDMNALERGMNGYADATNAVYVYQESLDRLNEEYGTLQGQMLGLEAQQDLANQKMQESSVYVDESAAKLASWSEQGVKAYNDALEAAEKSLSQQSGLFADLDIKVETSISQMSANLQEQTNVFDQYANDLQRASQLANELTDPEFKEIVANIESMGVDGAGYLHQLVEAAETNGTEFQQLLEDWADMTAARSQLEDTMATFEADYTDGINTLADKQLEFHEGFNKESDSFFTTVKDNTKTATEEVNKTVDDSLDGINQSVEQKTPILQTSSEQLSRVAKEAIESNVNYDDFYQIGEDAGRGLEEGLRSKIDAVKTAAQELANAANTGAKSSKGLDEHSPSRTMHEIGALGGEGLVEGFEETLPDVIDAVQNAMPNEDNIEVSTFQNLSVGANTEGNGILTNVASTLARYLPQLANMQVVLDTGRVAGALAPGINNELGRISNRRV